MEHFLDSRQLAAILEINVRQLNYKVQIKDVPEPDMVIGRTRLWKRTSVKTYLHELEQSIQRKVKKLGDKHA
ncbi:hypothetical protein COL23_25600 [Priestia aryabhattai]|uniref:hypothetical protein n=1 Tax=Priestia aryabhattai TaxID=412384 RepID=UPI000BF3BFA3|nr:hypothetical protein [Priestia aryabhattai]PFW72128.1 hypothetical protein COL23_25600 [Priestia aryabhattai]